jgi:hypothetical protein
VQIAGRCKVGRAVSMHLFKFFKYIKDSNIITIKFSVQTFFKNVACFSSHKSEDNNYGETSPNEKTMVEFYFF